MGDTVRLLLIWLGTVSLLAFFLFGWDKLLARRHRRRVPEAALLGSVLCGGAFGGLLGMLLFRHKTRKGAFRVLVPLAALLQAALFCLAALAP
ncbi:MAG: DUF1294 domain-containing protein [Candidatus Enterenecus sp.]